MSKRELANLAEELDFDVNRKTNGNRDGGEELCFTHSANEMYNKMKGLDASSHVAHSAEQAAKQQKICNTRKIRPRGRRILATVNPRRPLPVPAPKSNYYLA